GMPVGFWIVNVSSDQALRIFLGTSTIIATVVLLRRSENHSFHPAVESSFAFASGVLNVSIGTNGSPLVFALQGRRLTPNQFRATIAVIFAVSAVVTSMIFAVDGRYTSRILLLALSALPSWSIGTLTGRNVANKIDQQQFRSVVLLLLAITGISTLGFAL
ncbi:MAG: sulfite exporter TauE/SafE family protein, partial [Actinomycetota bacterium]|nr:sulfite exporter TauE/SafE family protein [Actinomycetota bacterium]